jgi:hypothetical protein
MGLLESIKPILADDVFQTTGNMPLLVLCSDLNEYVTKYNRNRPPSTQLLNEFICASFLEIWNLRVPESAFIKIKQEHITKELGIPFGWFKSTCFGSKRYKHYKEVDQFFIDSSVPIIKNNFNQDDFLKIGLFDIWVANEDRNPGNTNLLYFIDEDGRYQFVPIDHGAVFNSNNLNKGLVPITEQETLIFKPLIHKICKKRSLKDENYLTEIEEEFYFCVRSCKDEFPEILKKIPPDWKIDIVKIHDLFEKYLFSDSWIDISFRTFLTFIGISLNH